MSDECIGELIAWLIIMLVVYVVSKIRKNINVVYKPDLPEEIKKHENDIDKGLY